MAKSQQPARYLQLGIFFFLQYFVWGSWFVTLGTYLLETLQYSGREVGLVYTCTAIAATVTPFLMGRLADQRYRAERLLAFLHIAGGFILLAVAFVEPFPFVFGLLCLYALLYMPSFGLSNAIGLYHLRDARDFPKVRVGGTFGWIATGLLLSWLDWEPTRYPLMLGAASSLMLGVYCYFMPETPPQPTRGLSGLQALLSPELIELLKRRRFAVLMFSIALIAVPMSFYYSFVNPFLSEIGMPNPAGSMTLGQVSEVIFMLSLPWFLGRVPFRWLIAIGLFAWGLRYALFAQGDMMGGQWLLYLGIALHGVGFNFTIVTAQIWVDQQAPANIRNTAQSFISFLSMGLMALLGTVIAGEVVGWNTLDDKTHDWPSIWWVPATIGMLIALFFWLAFRKPKAQR